MLFYKVV